MTPKPKPSVDFVTVSIRFPRPLYNMILVDAERAQRSFNQQVIWIVKQVLGITEKPG